MREANLPSPGTGNTGYHLRRVAAKAISDLEKIAPKYPTGVHPSADSLAAFFSACLAAANTLGKAIPALALTTAGDATEVEVGDTLATTLDKGGSSGAVTYASSDTDIATVDGSGVITGVAPGVVTITASVAEGTAHKAGTVSVTVEVIEA